MFNIQDNDTKELMNTLHRIKHLVILEQFFSFFQDFLKIKNPHFFDGEVDDYAIALYHKGVELIRLELRQTDVLEIDVLELADGLSKPYAGQAATPKGYTRHSFPAEIFCRSLTQQLKRLSAIDKLLNEQELIPQEIGFVVNKALIRVAVETDFKTKLFDYLRQDAPYLPLLKSILPTILLKEHFVKIASSDSFYFEHARNCWQQIISFEADFSFYERLLQAYQSFNGRYDEFVTALSDKSPAFLFCNLLGEFVSYADEKAVGRQHWNKYEDKRTFISASVRQDHWITQLIRYKQLGGQEQILSANVGNAIQYIEDPIKYASVLSENHRQLISKQLLNKKYETTNFDTNLVSFFEGFQLEIKSAENRSHYISTLLYYPALAELWKKDTRSISDASFESTVIEEPWTAYHLMPAKLSQPLNLILYGPPGTGKTYRTIQLAMSIVEGVPEVVLEQSGSYRVQKQFEAHCMAGTIAMLSFHQSMSYEDFIEGLKPKSHNGQLQYALADGILKEIALRASEDPMQPYVLIIDEINRGNVAGIFGELISLLEEDKRMGAEHALQIRLPYSKTLFSLPSNLYILGTMNTADRNIESLDIALRRRFNFRLMLPKPALLPKISRLPTTEEEIDLSSLLFAINRRLELLLDADHLIGHAYLWGIDSLESLNNIFETKIIPLLEEYFYGNLAKVGLVLGKAFIEELPKSNIRFADFSVSDQEDIYFKSIYRVITFPRTANDYRAIYINL